MTSSLVGSEMCIRDRGKPECSGRAPGRDGADEGCAIAVEHRSSIAGGAVSYTHLTLPTICSV
eukprot:4795719-Prorocentrum_lima.AAC.1